MKLPEGTPSALGAVSKYIGNNDSLVRPDELGNPSLSSGFRIHKLLEDLFLNCMNFLKEGDVVNVREVSKSYRDLIDGPQGQVWWRQLSIKEGIPIVEGEGRNCKDDFLFLRPITVSGKTISQYLGEVVGEVPLMRKDCFLQLQNSQDPFEPEKSMRDTYVVLVDPSFLRITVSPDRPLVLDTTRTLVQVPIEGRGQIVPEKLTVPFSFKNLRMLATHPLSGRKHGSVFDKVSGIGAFEQCNTPPSRNGIRIMRRAVVGRGMPFDGEQGQNALVTKCGQEVVTVRERAFYDAIEILKTGACPDLRGSGGYVRSAESVSFLGFIDRAAVGGFAPGVGMGVGLVGAGPRGGVVVPGVPGEV